ncbi:MAG: DNA internalization-related competence protein ComEC/Rec2 [Oscillospiraceae bacterium]|nr:DNA internalization-related competence protein ComEC/Rec2 [Oscillospiraceae bacterium]
MRVLATVCFAFAAGIAAAQYLLPLWLLPYAALGCAVLGALWALLLHGRARTRAALVALGLTAALVWNYGYVRLVQMPFEALAGQTLTLSMEAADYPYETDYGCRVEVRILAPGLHGKAVYYADRALLDLAPGMRLRARVSANSASSIRGEPVSTHTARGVYLLLYSRGEAAVERGRAGALRYLPQRLAHRVEGMTARLFPERTRAFINAILLGERYALSAEDKVSLSEAGLSHVTAVSGMHCAFLLSILYCLIGRHRLRLLCVTAIPLLFLYALTVGMTPSVVRACIMLSLLLLAPLFERESDPPTSLGLALLLILLQNPFAVKSVSLQLSFAALAGLLCVTGPLVERMHTKRLGKRYGAVVWFVLASLATTAGAQAFTVPLSAVYFGSLVLVGVLSNLLCLWAASLTFSLALVSVALGFVYVPAARLLALLPHYGALYLLRVARLLGTLPYHAVYFNSDGLRLWLVYVYALLAACVLLKGRLRYPAALTLALVTLALTLWLDARPFQSGALHLVALDVGQGQSVVLRAGDKTALIDCGSSSYLDAGDIAADYLLGAGVRTLDCLLLSHYHDDHCDGLPTLLARMEVRQLLLPDIAPDDPLRAQTLALAAHYGIPVTFVREDVTLPLGAASLTVFAPLSDRDMNEECLTVLCSAGDFDALFTADIDADSEYRLIATHNLPDVEVMMAGHHGSRYSTGEDLLAELRPETAIVSCGAGNRYGHPDIEALRRLDNAGAEIYRTDLQGTIHITVKE